MKRKNFLFLLGCVLGLTLSASAATFTVNNTSDTLDANPGNGVCADSSGFCTLRAAIGEANALAGADVIILPAGTYETTIPTTNEDLNANGDLDITGDLTITGAGEGTTFVQAAPGPGIANDRVFHIPLVNTNVTIENITIRNGRLTSTANPAGRGGGIQNLGNLTLKNATVSGNSTVTRGGGIHSVGSPVAAPTTANSLTLSRVTVTGNSIASAAENVFGGGMFTQFSNVGIGASTFSNNNAFSSFTDSFGFAAGAYLLDGTININNSTFTGNNGSGNGAGGSQGTGLRFNSSSTTVPMIVNITNTTINNNTGNTSQGSSHGGVGMAINVGAGSSPVFALTNLVISGNIGSSSGGGLSIGGNGGTITVNNSTVTNNSLSSTAVNNFGGGIALLGNSTLTLNSSTVSLNSSTATNTFLGFAGGVYNQGGVLILNNTNVNNNVANLHSGIRALASTTSASTTLNSSTVNGNIANGGDGAGVVNFPQTGLSATLNLNNSTVSGNSATGAGGGVLQSGTAGTATTNINNSTIAGNVANSDSTGAESGGGVGNGFGTITFKNTIIADNSVGTGSAGPDCAGTLTSANFNVVENSSGCTVIGTTTNNLSGDPSLGALSFNGGLTRTHALGAQSIALNAGDPTNCQTIANVAVTADERGLPRSQGGVRCDIGAFERGGIIWTSNPPARPDKGEAVLIAPNDWNDPSNWSGGVVPGANDYAIFNSSGTNSVVLSSPTSVAGILYGAGYGGTLTLNANLTVTERLQMSGSNITVSGANNLIIGTAGSITRDTGFVNGNVRKDFAAPGSFTYPVGILSYYLPATINVTAGTGSFTVKPNGSVLAGTASPGSLYVYWTLTPSGITTADLTFNYPDTAYAPASNESAFQFVRRTAGNNTFIPPTSFNTTSNIFTLTGVTTFSDWGLGIPGTTAAGASIGGRVITPEGRGITNALVTLTGGDLTQPLTAITGRNGRYELPPVSVGQTYLVTVSARRFTFSEPVRVIHLTDSIADADFVSGGVSTGADTKVR